MKNLLWKVIDRACDLKKIKQSDLTGKLWLKNSIPIGAGLGASAALCVALARWFEHLKLVNENDIYEFSRSLEDLFHGESSGVDIAVALSGAGLRFSRSGERATLAVKWNPQWYLSYSGQRGITSTCVRRVKDLIEKNSELGLKIDADMREAVRLAEVALGQSEAAGFANLQKSMSLALSCFERWDLVSDEPVAAHLRWLKEQGAIAVKPTGSGGGGYVLSLWQSAPPRMALLDLIPCS
jgi:mevalonate kinase